MKSKLLIASLIIVVIAACNKDQYTTKPQLTFISVNKTEFVQGDVMEFTFEYTDKEGDIQNRFYVEEVTYDENCPENNYVSNYNVPSDVPQEKQAKGTIRVRFIYNQFGEFPIYTGPKCQRNDTCYFRFALIDKASNSSDTITTPDIVFIK